MIKNFNEWNESAPVDEGVGGAIKSGFKAVGKAAQKLFVKGGVKGGGKVAKEALEEVIEQSTKKVTKLRDLAVEAEKNAEVAKKILRDLPDTAEFSGARKAAQETIEHATKVRTLADEAAKSVDDALRSGDDDAIRRARMFADDGIKKASDLTSASAKSAKAATGGSARYFARTAEEGTGFADDFRRVIDDSGGDIPNSINRQATKTTKEGKGRFLKLAKGVGKVIIWPFKSITGFLTTAALIAGGAVVYNYLRDGEQNKATEKIKQLHDDIGDKLWKEQGVAYTKMDVNKISFKEFFLLFFGASESALPQKDANELKIMLKGDVTTKDFFSKLSQMCFEYPSKEYLNDFERATIKSSSFYSYMLDLEKEIGIGKIVNAINDAEGKASKTLIDTFSENGEPKVVKGVPIDFSNPNMKILLGSNEPVKTNDLIEESKQFLSMMSSLKKKITNDSIESEISQAINENSIISQEEMQFKSDQITKELREQLSEKEEVFVAISGLMIAYNKERYPFNSIYKFDPDNFYSTSNGIEDFVQDTFTLDTYNQLGRIYINLSADATPIFKSMGKDSSLFGVMEYSHFGNVMKSLLLLYLLEKICKMIVGQKEDLPNSAEFTGSEIKEYQTVINQIQKKEGISPTVTLTGKLDDETKEAIKKYQGKLGLAQTGLPGDISLPKLREYLISLITSA